MGKSAAEKALDNIPAYRRGEFMDDMKKFMGIAPYDGPSNIARDDGYYASSLVRRYGMSFEDLKRAFSVLGY